MASARRNAAFGTGGYAKAEGDTQHRGKEDAEPKIAVDTSPEANDKRMAYCASFLHFYDDLLASKVKDRKTKQIRKQSLGRFHHWLIDFLNIDLYGSILTYSPLPDYMPDKDEYGNYPERWLYWKTLDHDPEVQDGPEGPIASMFYDKFWQGIVIRICGDGFTKCALAPRGHLKSTIGAQYGTLWRSIREPAERHAIRCVSQQRAKDFLVPIAQSFTANDAFMKLWGNYKSEKRDNSWNTERIQYDIPRDQRRGVDPTVLTAGLETDLTGTHPDNPTFDDIVAESNASTAMLLAKTRGVVSASQAQREPDSNMHYIGTRWDEDDAAALFVGKPGTNDWSGTLSEDTCFFVATVFDGDESVKVPPLASGQFLTPLGFGKPIWPEGFPLDIIKRKRRGSTDDKFYCAQYFNQTIGTSNRIFKRAWIRNYGDAAGEFVVDGRTISLSREELEHITPVELARKLKLNITLGNDTASGKKSQAGKLDRTAGVVLGQTQDRTKNFVLDGYREKLPAEQIALAIVDKAVKWNKIAMSYRGSFRAGFEDNAYTNFLEPLIRHEQKKFGPDAVFAIEQLSHQNDAKVSRAKLLATPHCDGMFFWPAELIVEPTRLSEEQIRHGEHQIEPYDFRELLEGEFVVFSPTATADDIIDAYAYSYAITFPMDWSAGRDASQNYIQSPVTIDHNTLAPGTWVRGQAVETPGYSYAGLEGDGEVSLG